MDYKSQQESQAWAYPGCCSMKRLGEFPLPLDGILVHRRVIITPSIKFVSTHLYTWVEREALRVKVSCLRTQHNVRGPCSNPDRLIRDMRTNHEATAPPLVRPKSRTKCHVMSTDKMMPWTRKNRSWTSLSFSTTSTFTVCVFVWFLLFRRFSEKEFTQNQSGPSCSKTD